MSIHSDSYNREGCDIPLHLQHNIRLCDEGAPYVVKTRDGWRWCGLCCAWWSGNHGGSDKHTKRVPYCFTYSWYGPPVPPRGGRTIFRNPDGSAMFNGKNFGLPAAAAICDDSSLMADNLPAVSAYPGGGTADPLPGGAYPGGAYPGGAYPGGAYPGGAYPGGAHPGGAYPGGISNARDEIQRLGSDLQAAQNEIRRLENENDGAPGGGDPVVLTIEDWAPAPAPPPPGQQSQDPPPPPPGPCGASAPPPPPPSGTEPFGHMQRTIDHMQRTIDDMQRTIDHMQRTIDDMQRTMGGQWREPWSDGDSDAWWSGTWWESDTWGPDAL